MTFADYIIYIFNLGVAMGAVLAFIVIAYSGINILSSSGNPSAKQEAKKKIISALLGLAVLLVSYVLLTTINPDLVALKNVSLVGVHVDIPILTPEVKKEVKETITFQELPIGTLVESILSGNSSTKNALECYEYNEDGNIIDKNSDGQINEKDIILDRDIFYCMKDLEEALRKKAEVELSRLIKELDVLMKECECSRVYTAPFPPNPLGRIGMTTGTCVCPTCGESYCNLCGHSHTGCPEAPGNNLVGEPELEQYPYDPCPNRKQIDCKREEIKQLMDGSDPEKICYEKGWIKEDAPKYPNMVTFKDGTERLSGFKDYFTNQVNKLKQVELSTKRPFGERLSIAEFHSLQNQDNSSILASTPFEDYDISRYCDDYCVQKGYDNNIEVCVKYDLNEAERMCKMVNGQERYLYDGDPATFYFSQEYNDKKQRETAVDASKDDTCSVYDKKYSGVIPIGETVDETERYGEELVKRIEDLIKEVKEVYNSGLSIAELPNNCDGSNCKLASSNCCVRPQCNSNSTCPCPSIYYTTCYPGEAAEDYPYPEYSRAYIGCSDLCIEHGDPMPRFPLPREQYWACPYRSFCDLIKSIYAVREIDDSCYDSTKDEAEATLRISNLAKAGALQRWAEREKRLFALSSVDSLEEIREFDPAAGIELVNTICPEDMRPDRKEKICDIDDEVCIEENKEIIENKKKVECNSSLTEGNTIKNRFVLIEMLLDSRRKMNSCITGYGSSYKENKSQTQIFNCLEGINHVTLDKLVILPDFPYPNTKNEGYQNCYPYNSLDLTKEQRSKCFQNINRVGDGTNPGCQMDVEEYMDNYYCCK
ncbi:MAG: hypothetical protein WC998_00260 [Candidatus Paceibacterota bacterium]|jgi:hypothetical protein